MPRPDYRKFIPFFFSLFSRFFFFLFSILCTRRIVAQLTMNIGYRYFCAWRVKMNFCANAFHVCEAAWNNEQEQYNHKVKQCRFVFANTRSRAPFFLSPLPPNDFHSANDATPHSSLTKCTVNCVLCLFIRFAISFIHAVLAAGWRQRDRVKCRRCELLLINKRCLCSQCLYYAPRAIRVVIGVINHHISSLLFL